MSDFLVWSNQHGMWWRAHRRGYTQHIEEAGRYSREDADAIVRDATVGGQLGIERTDPVTGREYRQFTEVVLLAPEAAERLVAGQHWIVARDGGRFCERCEWEVRRGEAYELLPGAGGLLQHVHCPDQGRTASRG